MSHARASMHEKHCRWLRCAHNKYRLDGEISEECAVLGYWLSRIEDDRAHREAVRLRQRAEATHLDLLNPYSLHEERLVRGLAVLVDPYELRDGQLVRKSDGKPVIL